MTGVKVWLLIALLVLVGLFVLKNCRQDPIALPPSVVKLQDSLRESRQAHAQTEERLKRAADSAIEEAALSKRRADSAVKTANYFKRIADQMARVARRNDSLRNAKVARVVYDTISPARDTLGATPPDTVLLVDTSGCSDTSWKTAYAARTQEAHQLRLALLHKDSALIAQLAATELERQRAEENGTRLARSEALNADLKKAIDQANHRCYLGPMKCRDAPKVAAGIGVIVVTVKVTQYVLKHWVK